MMVDILKAAFGIVVRSAKEAIPYLGAIEAFQDGDYVKFMTEVAIDTAVLYMKSQTGGVGP